jgi:hypothetical protein
MSIVDLESQYGAGEPSPATSGPLTTKAVEEALHAARCARHAYEGPIGDLVSRELRTYAEIGEQLPPSALGPRLVSEMQRQEARQPLPAPRSHAHLPARYVPGTPLHWRYRTVADQPESDPH